MATRERTDDLVAPLAERGPCEADDPLERTLGDDHVGPERIEQFALGDRTVATRDQIREELQHLRLDVHWRAVAAELATIEIELVACETERHPALSVPRHDVRRRTTPLPLAGHPAPVAVALP
jgi:hypothetical protein